jgi:hypothetical protein
MPTGLYKGGNFRPGGRLLFDSTRPQSMLRLAAHASRGLVRQPDKCLIYRLLVLYFTRQSFSSPCVLRLYGLDVESLTNSMQISSRLSFQKLRSARSLPGDFQMQRTILFSFLPHALSMGSCYVVFFISHRHPLAWASCPLWMVPDAAGRVAILRVSLQSRSYRSSCQRSVIYFADL